LIFSWTWIFNSLWLKGVKNPGPTKKNHLQKWLQFRDFFALRKKIKKNKKVYSLVEYTFFFSVALL
jgi:hypothetical protein